MRGTIVFLRVRIITRGGLDDLVGNDAVEVGLGGDAEDRFDSFGIDVVALVEPVVEAEQHFAGARSGVGFALDLHAVAARGDVDAEPLLDGDQVAVVVAEQRPEQIGLLELQLEPGAALFVGGDCGEVAAGHQAASFWRSAPAMLFGPAERSVTSMISPGSAHRLDVDRLQPRRAADHLAGAAALALDQDLRVAATVARLNAI